MAVTEIKVPDIGDFDAVDVIEVLVQPGDQVDAEDPLITLESDKASMDVPSPEGGTVQEVKIKVGDKVSEGSVIALLEKAEQADNKEDAEKNDKESAKQPKPDTTEAEVTEPSDDAKQAAKPPPQQTAAKDATDKPSAPAVSGAQANEVPSLPSLERRAPPPVKPMAVDEAAFAKVHASPSIRRFARELGVDLGQVQGTGRKGRITREDVQQFVKKVMQGGGVAASAAPAATGGMGIPPIPAVDFAQFGPVEEQPLSRIQKLSGPHLHRAWLNVPMVTHHDEADTTELEAFRQSLKPEAEKQGVRVTGLAFIMKALAHTLKAYPRFNSSLSPDGQSLILKQYVHLGIAVDTPNGLVVPVVRDVDQKSIFDLSKELGEVSKKARDGKLSPKDLAGGCMSISSLGGIGGTGFTPIVNAPEVAILGVTRAQMKPVWDGTEFIPRLITPLDLTFDHRVIDGALAARFMVSLTQTLADVRRILL